MNRLLAVVVKALVGLAVLGSGFRAVSDDDFARVVLMQGFAHEPALDPTGTSWLPFPFWLNGAAMLLTGTSLTAARALAFAWGLLAALLLYEAGRLLFDDPRKALGAAVVGSILPWSARLGVATVPELPTAALTVFAAVTLTRSEGRIRVLGALALLAATLSRYEPWFVAACFAALTLWDARDRDRLPKIAAALLALLGPIAWVVHNALAHGDPLHFVARVSAYKNALAHDTAGLLTAIAGYPLSLLREEPELCILSAALLIHHRVTKAPLPKSLRRLALVAAVLLLGLTAAALPGGAPTHHAGRALLTVWLLAALYVGAAATKLPTLPKRPRLYTALGTLSVIVLGAAVLRPWYARLDSWASREDATAIGATAATHLAATHARALVEVRDYGYYAVQAGSGAPWRFEPDRSIDPRKPIPKSSFDDPTRLTERAASFTAIIGYPTDTTAKALGPPAATEGAWAYWRTR